MIHKDPHSTRDPVRLRAYLESIGDCVVVVDDDTIIKVHVHSNEPGNVIQEALKYGPLVNIKIDNMRQQHTNAAFDSPNEPETQPEAPAVQEPAKPFGFVAVAAGQGLKELFLELGADQVVSGGQTMNPSTEDILDAIMATLRSMFSFYPIIKILLWLLSRRSRSQIAASAYYKRAPFRRV